MAKEGVDMGKAPEFGPSSSVDQWVNWLIITQ
jgi:hypothetical protein